MHRNTAFDSRIGFNFFQCVFGSIHHSGFACSLSYFIMAWIVANDFAYSSCRRHGLQLHLQQAEFRMQISLHEIRVFIIFGENMRHQSSSKYTLTFPLQALKFQILIEVCIRRFRVLPESLLRT